MTRRWCEVEANRFKQRNTPSRGETESRQKAIGPGRALQPGLAPHRRGLPGGHRPGVGRDSAVPSLESGASSWGRTSRRSAGKVCAASSARISVVLPAPLSPAIRIRSPGRTATRTSRSTGALPEHSVAPPSSNTSRRRPAGRPLVVHRCAAEPAPARSRRAVTECLACPTPCPRFATI